MRWTPSLEPRARGRALDAENALPRSGGEAAGGEADDWLWRHRRELFPVWAVLGLVILANLGHLASPGTPLDPLFILPSAMLLLFLRMRSQSERAFILRSLPWAIIWTCSCWGVGLEDPVVLGALLVGAPAAVLVWLALHRRSSIEIVTDAGWWDWSGHRDRRRAERTLVNVHATWDWIARCSGIPGAEIHRRVWHHEDGHALHIELPRGRVGKDIQIERLASALREFPIGPILTPDPAMPWRVVITERRPEEPDQEEGIVNTFHERLEQREAERLHRLASAGGER